ncbi:hypothetical protein ACHAXA_002556 [Cyclostephanos tholiformis]|uniref:Phosphatidate cytidylyltransferase n=1 Tax=Cyclostephanos tholiformis TaxID=382380 RepID=A0ABD3R0U3_9STRA
MATRYDMMNDAITSNITSSPSEWRDLPRRILTVTLGVPSIILMLRYSLTSWLFFQGAHLICLIEWKALIPTSSVKKSQDDATTRKDEKVTGKGSAGSTPKANNAIRSFLRVILDDDDEDDDTTILPPLSNGLFSIFCFSSLLVSILPTSYIPLGLMVFGIAPRLIPHLPGFQSSTSLLTTTENARFFVFAMQHYQFGLAYISIGFHFILQISKIGGPIHIGNLLFVVWMSDTGALILGRLMKGGGSQATTNSESRKGNGTSFLKSISPGKTLSGLLGAVITGPISSAIYPILLPSSTMHHPTDDEQFDIAAASCLAVDVRFPNLYNLSLSQRAFLGLILSSSGIVGDLAESSVKRLSEKKDSGGLLPGHGGVVDRFDSLFVAGVAYYYWMLA